MNENGQDVFKLAIADYLCEMAEKDQMFAVKLGNPNKSIDQCCDYIYQEVQKSGRYGFKDEEIYGMAVHYYDEADLKVEKFKGNVKVIGNYDLSEREKEEARQAAIKEYQNEIIRKMQQSSQKPKKVENKEEQSGQLSMF